MWQSTTSRSSSFTKTIKTTKNYFTISTTSVDTFVVHSTSSIHSACQSKGCDTEIQLQRNVDTTMPLEGQVVRKIPVSIVTNLHWYQPQEMQSFVCVWGGGVLQHIHRPEQLAPVCVGRKRNRDVERHSASGAVLQRVILTVMGPATSHRSVVQISAHRGL